MDTTDALPPLDPNLLAPTRPEPLTRLSGGAVNPASVKRSAQDFESFFVTSMLESMTAGLKTNKLFGGGAGETMYRSMLNQEYGKAIAASGTLGISDSVQREILRMQEGRTS